MPMGMMKNEAGDVVVLVDVADELAIECEIGTLENLTHSLQPATNAALWLQLLQLATSASYAWPVAALSPWAH